MLDWSTLEVEGRRAGSLKFGSLPHDLYALT